MDESTLSTEELFLVFCCTIEELYREAAPDRVRTRPGSDRLEMSDAEIITLSVMQEGRLGGSELSFHRMVEKDYQHLFPDLLSRSRYHRVQKFLHSKDPMGIQREILRLLMDRLGGSAAWLIVDSAPITVAESPRWKSARRPTWAAEAGYSPSKRQFFLGFRLHALVSNTGVQHRSDFRLCPQSGQCW